jgi:predicted phage tail protein
LWGFTIMPLDGGALTGEIMEDAPPSIRATIIYNAMEPSDRTIADLLWAPGKTLTQYLDSLPEDQDWIVVTPTGVFERPQWEEVVPEIDDRIAILLAPNKGIGSIFAIVATLALAIIAPALGAALGPTLATAIGIGGQAFWGGVVSGLVMVLGTALVSALGPKVQNTAQNQGPDSSPSYALTGAKNTATEGVPLPVAYGSFWCGGNRVNFYTENSVNGLSQVAYMQYVVSEGEIQGISEVRINGQPLGFYQNIVFDSRNGTLDQTPMGWFASAIETYENGTTLSNTTQFIYTTQAVVDRFSINLVCPQGLYHVDSKTGNSQNLSVPIEVSFAQVGTNNWQSLSSEYTWVAIDPNDATTPACNGIRVTVQAQGDANGPTTPFNFQVGWRNDTGPLQLGTTINGSQGFSWTQQYSGGSNGGFIGDRGVIGSDSGIIINEYTVDPSGATSFTPGVVTRTYEITGLNIAGYSLNCSGGTIVAVEVQAFNNLVLTANERSQLHFTISSPVLDKGQYQIRIIRGTAPQIDLYTEDQVVVESISEIQAEDVAYIGTAYYAVRVGLDTITSANTNLINTLSSEPTVVAHVLGRKVPIYDKNGAVLQTVWSDNPADIALDILTNWRNRYGIPTSRIDFVAFDRMRQNCAANGLTFNGVFDFQTTMWDALMYVMRAGHANLIMSGVKWSVILDAPADATMMFTATNIIKDSVQSFWIGTDNRYNSIEVQYYDSADYNRRHSQFAIDYNALANGQPIRATTINGVGYDNPQQAAQEAQLQLNKNLFLLQGCSFDAPIEAIGCNVGDVVYVQHDMPQWGYNAIVQSVVGNTITIDSEIPFNENGDWHALFVQGAVNTGTLAISILSGAEVRFIFGALTGAHRVVINGKDYLVIDEVLVGGELVITLDRPIDTTGGVGPGTAVAFYQTDVLSEAFIAPNTNLNDGALGADTDSHDQVTLLNEDGSFILSEEGSVHGSRSLTITGWVANAGSPQAGDRVMIGEVNKFKKPFWVTKIGLRDKNLRSVELIEYNATIYDGINAVPTPDYSALTPNPQQVTNLRASQSQAQLQGGSIIYGASCSWDQPLNDTHIYAGAKVYASNSFADFILIADVPVGSSTASLGANLGDLIRFKVVAYDTANLSADYKAAPIVGIEIGGNARVPAAPTNVVITPGIQQIAIRWDAINDDFIKGVEVWENPFSGDFSGAYLEWAGSANYFVRTGIMMGQTFYYWLRTASIAGTYSAFVGPFQATPTFALAADIGQGILDTSKFAESITPTELMTSLPTTGNFEGRQVYITTAGQQQLWIFRSGAWTPAVNKVDASIIQNQLTDAQIASLNATKIAGQLTDAQIASIASTKITGQLTNDQLDAIDATKIAGQLTSAQIASIDASQLTGQITGTQISNGAISTPQLAAGAITSANIAAGAITAGTIAANAVTAAALAAGSVTTTALAAGSVVAATIAAGAITTPAIAAGAITTAQIAAGAVTAATIAAGAITTPALSAGSVTAAILAAGAVTTSSLAVGSATNLCWNSCMEISSDGWNFGISAGVSLDGAGTVLGTPWSSSWRVPGIGSGFLRTNGNLPIGGAMEAAWDPNYSDSFVIGVPCKAGDVFEVQAQLIPINIAGYVFVQFLDQANNVLATFLSNRIAPPGSPNGLALSNYRQAWVVSTAPANSVTARAFIYAYNDNKPDLNSPGVTPYLFFTQFSIGPGVPNATAPQPWTPGGVSTISGGMIKSRTIASDRIATNAITANELAANSVIAGKISAGAVNSTEIAAGSIRAVHLASETILTEAAQIGAATIGTAQIQDLSVAGHNIADYATSAVVIAENNDTWLDPQGWAAPYVGLTVPSSNTNVLIYVDALCWDLVPQQSDPGGGSAEGGGGGGGDGGGF